MTQLTLLSESAIRQHCKVHHNPDGMIKLDRYGVNKSPYQVFAGLLLDLDVIALMCTLLGPPT